MSTQKKIAELGPWFHNLHLPDGTQTCPDHWLGDFPSFKWEKIAPHLPADLSGWRALDIGCNAGFYTLELAKRGAHVRGIDVDERFLTQARWAAEQFGLSDRVEFDQKQVYDLASEWETYDLVLFMGVFYHLRYPMLGLDIVAQKVKKLLLFQTLEMPGEEIVENTYDPQYKERDKLTEPGWPKMAFLEHQFAGDPTNWWAANGAASEAMLRSSGMRIVGRPGRELYLCEPDRERPSCIRTWNAEEYQSAVCLTTRLTKTLHFKNCWVNTSPGYTETAFHDGTRVCAAPEDSPEYQAKAAQFGYGEDLAGLSREHEILHTFLAEKLGYGASPTLWAVAHNQENVAQIWEQVEEEAWVLAFQTYLHGGEASEPLNRFADFGLDVNALCEEARKLLR